tara:strand:- start:198 stop:860 length:663 start_codon:yes stop_codon:yes gene_type:complete
MFNNKINLLVVIPLKNILHTKTRLKKILSYSERKLLTNYLLFQLIERIEIIRKSLTYINIDLAITTSNKLSIELLNIQNFFTISDKGTKSLSSALDYSAVWASKNNYDALCIFPSDLQNPHKKDLKKFLSPPFIQNEMRICPSIDLGTNALLVSPPDLINFNYGKKSFDRHITNAKKKGLKTSIIELRSLTLDVDEEQDFKQACLNMSQISKLDFPLIIK